MRVTVGCIKLYMLGADFVVDASVIVKLLNQDREPYTAEAVDILEKAINGSMRLCTSDLAVHEVCNALIKGKGLKGRTLKQAIESFFVLPIGRIMTDLHLAAIATTISEEYNVTFYDAIYMAVAFDLGIPLITANPKHQRPLPQVNVISLEQWAS